MVLCFCEKYQKSPENCENCINSIASFFQQRYWFRGNPTGSSLCAWCHQHNKHGHKPSARLDQTDRHGLQVDADNLQRRIKSVRTGLPLWPVVLWNCNYFAKLWLFCKRGGLYKSQLWMWKSRRDTVINHKARIVQDERLFAQLMLPQFVFICKS